MWISFSPKPQQAAAPADTPLGETYSCSANISTGSIRED
jgi:hypothetical protein